MTGAPTWLHLHGGVHSLDKRSERFDVDEFLRRIAERSGADEEAALQRARSVFAVLAQTIAPSELDDVASELPKDFDLLLPRGAHIEVLPAGAFFARVAERAAIGAEDARRATEAVLETLAERIAGEAVDDDEFFDVTAQLPQDYVSALIPART